MYFGKVFSVIKKAEPQLRLRLLIINIGMPVGKIQEANTFVSFFFLLFGFNFLPKIIVNLISIGA